MEKKVDEKIVTEKTTEKKRMSMSDKLEFRDNQLLIKDKKLEKFVRKEIVQASLKLKKAKAIIEEKLEGHISVNVNITLTPTQLYLEGKDGQL